MEQEGVIKFEYELLDASLTVDATELIAWRAELMKLGLVGQDPARYGGLGFGNLSKRTNDGFLVSGSQTGDITDATIDHFCEIVEWDLNRHWLRCRGQVKPSSESLTHAAVYEVDERIQCVFHVHDAAIWNHASALDIPVTPSNVAYGTAEMAKAVKGLLGEVSLPAVFSMGGHEDGVVALGDEPATTGQLLLRLLSAANLLNKS